MEIYRNIDDIVILISVIFDKNYENLQYGGYDNSLFS